MPRGHVEDVNFAKYILREELPHGKRSIVLWAKGFSMIFQAIHNLFEEGIILTAGELEWVLSKLPNNKQQFFEAYNQDEVEVDFVLKALVYGARDEWEDNDFEGAHCDSGRWDALSCDCLSALEQVQ